MVTLNKPKYAININLTTLDVTHNPDKQLIRTNYKIQTIFEMQMKFCERQFTVFPVNYYR